MSKINETNIYAVLTIDDENDQNEDCKIPTLSRRLIKQNNTETNRSRKDQQIIQKRIQLKDSVFIVVCSHGDYYEDPSIRMIEKTFHEAVQTVLKMQDESYSLEMCIEQYRYGVPSTEENYSYRFKGNKILTWIEQRKVEVECEESLT
jgi:5-hydroxyisourate hydrolase-like protein (transthyretin family)